MCEMDIKINARFQEFYRAGTAPPGFEIPGSATDTITIDVGAEIGGGWN